MTNVVQKHSHLHNTTTDSPLELLQENSKVHAPLGAEDGNLGVETDTYLDKISLSVVKITPLLA